jgi:hypothetical protein
MISDSSAMARMAASFTLGLAARQKAMSAARAWRLDVIPNAQWRRRCLTSSSQEPMNQE